MTDAWTGSRDIFDAITLLAPYDVDVSKIRYGSPGDGGYVFANKITSQQPILSFGVSDNCDLEYDFAERGHKVFMFDPSVSDTPKHHKNFTFYQIGVAAEDNEDRSFLSLASCLDLCGLKNRTDVILKIDTEGAEYETFSSIPAELLLCFEQIALEIHWLERLEQQEFREKFCKSLRNVNKYFINFHVHANNCAPVVTVGGKKFQGGHSTGGFPVASVLELSYIRRDLTHASNSQTYYPTSLDFPNHPFYPDHILSFYPFLPTSISTEAQLEAISRINDFRIEMSGFKDTYI